MRRLLATAVAVLAAVGGLFWYLTAPDRLDPKTLAAFPAGDAGRGETMFWAGGCTSCHARPNAKEGEELQLAGGIALATDFGTFVAPNISQHPGDGIGAWSLEDFANAMMRGVSPQGAHYYPAFPYSSYARMTSKDIADLFAFMKTLPEVEGQAPGHDLGFPFNIRRGLGLWKKLYLNSEPVVALGEEATPVEKRGQYLVEGPGHCGECHTPRSLAGGPELEQWLAGAAAAEGEGIVPNLTPHEAGLAGWSAADISYYLESGFTPEFDSVGGSMVAVQKNMARLAKEDRDAIAAYLKALPARPNGYPSSR